MARNRNTQVQFTGSVGKITSRKIGDNYYYSEKVTSHKSTRTERSMRNQLPMGNIMSMLRMLKEYVPDLFEGCPNRQSARGKYVSLNKNRDVVYFTNEQQKSFACILAGHQISAGTLTSIAHTLTDDKQVLTDIRLLKAITRNTTVKSLSEDILRNNPSFAPGDKLSLYLLRQNVGDDTNVPTVEAYREVLVLDPRNEAKFSTIDPKGLWRNHDGVLALDEALNHSAATFVHSRIDRRGELLVSPQTLVCVNDLIVKYSTKEAFLAAVESRGGFTNTKDGLTPDFIPETKYENNPTHSHTVTIFCNNPNMGTVSPKSGNYLHGDTVTLNATPTEGCRFIQWINNMGEPVSTESLWKVRITADSAFTAIFTAENK